MRGLESFHLSTRWASWDDPVLRYTRLNYNKKIIIEICLKRRNSGSIHAQSPIFSSNESFFQELSFEHPTGFDGWPRPKIYPFEL